MLGFAALSESGKSLAGDESSLGILQLDGLPGNCLSFSLYLGAELTSTLNLSL